jgi:hypothetical protein
MNLACMAGNTVHDEDMQHSYSPAHRDKPKIGGGAKELAAKSTIDTAAPPSTNRCRQLLGREESTNAYRAGLCPTLLLCLLLFNAENAHSSPAIQWEAVLFTSLFHECMVFLLCKFA